MTPLAEHMSLYAAYHRHPVNRAIHFVFVPAIVWSLMLALGGVTLATFAELAITPAHVAVAALLVFYLALDFPLGVAATVLFTALLASALQTVLVLGTTRALLLAGVLFVGGFAAQFVGHAVWERRRPALAVNILQVFIAPIFLVAETAFALGLRKSLHDDVQARMQRHLAAPSHTAAGAAA